MAVTPNYSWPVPVNTDLVKDGAEAIKDLGDAIDATVFGLPSGGITLINATTITAGTTVNIDSVFSVTYRNYLILVDVTKDSSDITFNLQLRAGGVTNTSTIYQRQELLAQSTTVAGARVVSQTSWGLALGVRATQTAIINMFSPQLNVRTKANFQFGATDLAFSTLGTNSGFLYHSTNYQADGVALLFGQPATGTARIYGYKD